MNVYGVRRLVLGYGSHIGAFLNTLALVSAGLTAVAVLFLCQPYLLPHCQSLLPFDFGCQKCRHGINPSGQGVLV